MNTTLDSDQYRPDEKSLETRIGLYWLHRLGVISLVFGIVFLIMYSFSYFTPVLKLCTGLIVSATLILLGGRMAKQPLQRWFGYGLVAGGWSLSYFTVYAAYYLPVVHVIDSLPLETVLLMTVGGGCLVSALQARSEPMAIYSVTLAAASILMSQPGLLSDISYLVIAVATSILGNRNGWRKLWAFGLAACYAGHVYCSSSALFVNDQVVASVFLCAIWLAFTVGLGYSVHASKEAREFTMMASCFNSVALAGGLVFFSGRSIPETSEMLLTFAGAVYLSAARWLHNRNENQLKIAHSLLGLTLINIAKAMHFSGLPLLAVDVAQIAFLALIGAKFDIAAFRWFAVLLTLFLFPIWLGGAISDQHAYLCFHSFPYVKLGIFAALTLCALTSQHMRSGERAESLKPYADYYYWAANLMVLFVIGRIIDPAWQACAMVVQAIVNHLIAMRLKDHFYLHPGTFTAFMAAATMYTLDAWQTEPTVIILVLLYAAHSLARNRANAEGELKQSDGSRPSESLKGLARLRAYGEPARLAHSLQIAYAYGANIVLTWFLLRQLPADYVSPALALEGICLLVIGFALSDSLFRVCGLAVMAILSGKLLFIDFAKFDTLGRVISFIAAGIVFLLSSYGYAKFTRSFEDKPSARP
jgi:hypothetical protein